MFFCVAVEANSCVVVAMVNTEVLVIAVVDEVKTEVLVVVVVEVNDRVLVIVEVNTGLVVAVVNTEVLVVVVEVNNGVFVAVVDNNVITDVRVSAPIVVSDRSSVVVVESICFVIIICVRILVINAIMTTEENIVINITFLF